MTEISMEAISRVRSAFAWMRKTGKPIAQYPKRGRMTERETFDATAFATGNYPTPTKWTRRLFELARGN